MFWNVLSCNLYSRVMELLPSHYTAQPQLRRPGFCKKTHLPCANKTSSDLLENYDAVLMQSWQSTLYPSEGKAQSNLAAVRVLGDVPGH